MNKTVTQVRFPKAPLPQLERVAAYARVSTGKDAMLHSLSAQVSHYAQLIQGHSGWQYVGVYADEALSGTKDGRQNFQRLIADCKAGKIDMVITKSISRFARNTVTLLQTVRDLKSLGVDVFFEEQKIHTMSAEGELMLTILASYAQEESLSVSENMKWRIRKNYEEGKPWSSTMLGYRITDGQYVIVPEEAEVVKRIYNDYLSGMGLEAIAKRLNTEGITTRWGYPWQHSCVRTVLQNYTYTGNLLLQKTFRENHMTKRKCINHGEQPMYLAEQAHEAIIPSEIYDAVQRRLKKQSESYGIKNTTNRYPFSGKLICANCGKKYRRKITRGEVFWICSTFNSHGKAFCRSKQIPEDTLIAVTEEVVGSLDALDSKITAIRVENNNTLVFCLADGTETVKRWQTRSRTDSWTKEMRDTARQRTLERRHCDA